MNELQLEEFRYEQTLDADDYLEARELYERGRYREARNKQMVAQVRSLSTRDEYAYWS